MERINKGLQASREDVVLLDSSKNVEKFSVRSTVGHHFVQVFKANNDDSVFIKCCSGVCSKRYSKLVNPRKMDEVNLCPHLDVFESYIDSN